MKDKTSYALGLSMANQFRSTGIHHLSIDDFTEAFRDVYEEKPTQVSYEEAQKLIESLLNGYPTKKRNSTRRLERNIKKSTLKKRV